MGEIVQLIGLSLAISVIVGGLAYASLLRIGVVTGLNPLAVIRTLEAADHWATRWPRFNLRRWLVRFGALSFCLWSIWLAGRYPGDWSVGSPLTLGVLTTAVAVMLSEVSPERRKIQ